MTSILSRAAFAAAALLLLPAAADGAPLAGSWIGTSRCVDRERAPACNDERIRFIFRDGGGGTLHLDARKWVGSAYDTMFEIDLTRDMASGGWVHDFETRGGAKARWTFAVGADGGLDGRLLERPSGAPLREVKATRER